MLYDTVHTFNNVKLSKDRHEDITSSLYKNNTNFQYLLSRQLFTQYNIMDIGVSANLLLAGFDVFTGRLSPGGFVLVRTFFEQLQ